VNVGFVDLAVLLNPVRDILCGLCDLCPSTIAQDTPSNVEGCGPYVNAVFASVIPSVLV
jgi:hypothetical protein